MRIVAGARLADGSSLREKIAIEPLGDVKASTLEASESSSESLYGAVVQIASLPVSCGPVGIWHSSFFARYNPDSRLRLVRTEQGILPVQDPATAVWHRVALFDHQGGLRA